MRTAALALLLWLTLAGTATAQERMCVREPPGPPPPTAEEQELQGWINARRTFGFRHDAAYVRRLERRGRFSVYGFPATKAEIAYLWRRNDLELGARAQAYLDSRDGVSAGLSKEDGWPGEPYLLVRFTRDVAHHLAALKRLAKFPDALRAKRARFSTRALERAQRRVGRDSGRLRAAGFHLQSWGPDIDRNVVRVELATSRTDAKAYFARRYGARVRPVVRATAPTVTRCTSATQFAFGADARTLTVGFEAGGGTQLERAEVIETAEQVEVGIVATSSTGPVTADSRLGAATVTLAAPLGDRPVIDIRTGRRIRQSGPTPGDPACPRAPYPRGETYTDAEQELLVDEPRSSRRRVTHTLDSLVEVQRRIEADTAAGGGFIDGYGRAGFFVIASEVEGQAVTVWLVSTRPDHAALFAARYGPTVRTEVIGDRFECATPLE